MKQLNVLLIPAVAFVAWAIWGFAALVPFAPKPHEWMLWIPASITMSGLAFSVLVVAVQDVVLQSKAIHSSISTWLHARCLSRLAFMVVSLAAAWSLGASKWGEVTFAACMILVLMSAFEVLIAAWNRRARPLAFLLVVAFQSGSLIFIAFLYVRSMLVHLELLGQGWFSAAIVSSGMASLLLGTYWKSAFQDPTAAFSPFLAASLRLLGVDGHATEADAGNDRALGRTGNTAKDKHRRRKKHRS